jgi:SAM-dependent methyltransferase
MHCQRFNMLRDSNQLPAPIAANLKGMLQGDRRTAHCPAGELVPAHKQERLLRVPQEAFDRHKLPGHVIEPRVGRFYPRAMLRNVDGISLEAWPPLRVAASGPAELTIDCNDPMAAFPLDIELYLEHVVDDSNDRAGHGNDCTAELLRGPGLKVPLTDGRSTDFCGPDGLAPLDAGDDANFYRGARMVQHLDSQALCHVRALYARLLPAGAWVLDLMASWDSHLDAVADPQLTVLGMNRQELDANQSARFRMVQDLNRDPQLPYPDGSFDAVVCTASIEYLTSPQQVLAEVRRVLRPGGRLIVTFSDRWFPTKAIRIWGELHEFERVGMVLQWLRQAGFGELNSFSARGWPRPQGDPYSASRQHSDPVHAVWGSRPAL